MSQNEAGVTIRKLTPRMMSRPFQSGAEVKSIWEQHHVHHALFYFSMLVESAIRGKLAMADGEKVKRIREHLLNLREFVGADTALFRLVQALLEKLAAFRPVHRRQFMLFVYENWERIGSFAAAYGHRERCFSEKHYGRLCDRIHHRHYFRLWWWKRKAIKMRLRMRRGYECAKDWLLWG